MEIIQTIWNSLTTPNLELANILSIPFLIIEAFVSMLLFTTILNIQTTKKQKILYVVAFYISIFFIKTFIPYPYNTFINIATLILLVFFILKAGFLKSMIAHLIPFIFTVIFETMTSKIFVSIFNMPYTNSLSIPIYRLLFMCFLYFYIFILYNLFKHFNLNISIFNNLNKKHKRMLIITFIIGFVAIGLQLYLTVFYSQNLPTGITLISMIGLLAYFFITLYNLANINQLEIANQDIENLQLYNKTLSILHDNIRAFKHDFNNIVSRNWSDLSLLKIWKV